uniref:Uncharacterized protein n=1 Tax=Pan paniscus TaxID=9597 RepID=A0A2R9ANJ5_PANPA
MQRAGNPVLTLPGMPFGKTSVPEAEGQCLLLPGAQLLSGPQSHAACPGASPNSFVYFPVGNVLIPLGCKDGTTPEGWTVSRCPANICGIFSTQQGKRWRQKPLQTPEGTHFPDPAHLPDPRPPP